MRLKLDENLGFIWRDQVALAGHDVDTVHEEGLSGAPDPAVLEAAIAEQRALITLDLDFANPFQFPPQHTPGIAVLRVRDRPGRRDLDLVVARLLDGLTRLELTGRLWVVEADRIRQYQPGVHDPTPPAEPSS